MVSLKFSFRASSLVGTWLKAPRDVRRTPGRPPLRWSDFVKSLNDRFDALRVPRASRTHWSTMARERDEWRRYWRPLEQIDDQRDDRMRADVRFLKRNNLSNMMRLGKRGSSAKRRELGEDWSLGNLMRLGRR
ncbi:unnamed protein product [Nippostrongylus brasiliensis]|uniref:Uncharacterized protein n=1 Tax=Nippostrongylus brasiliensis TaxID=27835 RepID=A0A0N4YP45_NIPBR|nr:unnamed protein product [Nippostrongylus brasiliensis]